MVDLHGGRGFRAFLKLDFLTGIRVLQLAGFDHAILRMRFMLYVRQITVKNVIACIASVMVDILPGVTELCPLVPGLRRTTLDGKCVKYIGGELAGAGIIGSLCGHGVVGMIACGEADRQQTSHAHGNQTTYYCIVITHGFLFLISWSLKSS